MAVFLTVDVLRVHAAPAFVQTVFWRADEPARPSPAPRARPALTAHWQVASDGRLTCRWQADGLPPLGPPPD
jgi:hypothetical protein